jgi:WD40 repeat protein/serine/threonine protein kinase
MSISDPGQYDLLDQLAEEFAARFRRGERPALKEYTDRYPGLAEEIRELFPALVKVEQAEGGRQGGEEKETGETWAASPLLKEIGDYRILREIGRGGMGVVYEAEQISLGRRVALKVLTRQVSSDRMVLERFRREARAAARLHHTNIVPVYEVGRDGDVSFYAMQLIQGQGLEQVIDELRWLRQPNRKLDGQGPPAPECPAPTATANLSPAAASMRLGKRELSRVASSLLSGRLLTEGLESPAGVASAAIELDSTEQFNPDASSDFTLALTIGDRPRTLTAEGVPASAVLPGGTAISSVDSSIRRQPFFRSVAQIGRQAAQGLAYAHSRGIVHRDVKPSNLLLDTAGVVWITDFGLAKAEDDGLTATGDILGTLLYMAPERFRGEGDARADVYALGLTLYELLTLKPAYDSSDRLKLIEQVKSQEPARPRSLDARIPRDLETIVLKAIEKDPKARYQTAQAMGEDLRRFLADEPIRARQVSTSERYWRWARRNPLIAVLGAVLMAVLIVGFAVMAVLWSRAEQSASIAKSNALTAQALATNEAKVRGEAQAQERIALKHERIALEKAELLAREDYVNRIDRAYREVQDDNVALAEDLLHGCPIERRGWEWHYVKRLCHPERLSVEVPARSLSAIAFSPDGRVIATGSGGQFFRGKRGSAVEFWDRETGQRLPTLHRTENVIWGLAFSPDGTKLALGGTNPQVEVRDAQTGAVRWSKHELNLPQAMSIAFSPDGKALAVGFGKYSQQEAFQVKIYEVETGRETFALPGPKGGVNDLAFHPDGRHLAVAGAQVVEVWDVGATKKVHELRGHSKWVYGVAYSPDGKWLATGGWDRTIKLRDAATGEEKLTIFAHDGFVLDLAFSPDSRSLVSTSEDRSVRLWEVPSGRPLGVLHGHSDFVQAVAFAPDGRELASGGLEGTLKVWDRRSSFPVVFDGHTGWVGRVWYRRDGRRVITAAIAHQVAGETTKGWDPSTGELDPALTGIDPSELGDEYLPPSEFPANFGPPRAATSPDGKLIARVWAGSVDRPMADRSKEYSSNSVEVLDAKSRRVLHTLIGHTASVRGFAFSPDGRRIVTSSWDRTIKLWDTDTGREVFTLRGHTAGVLFVGFSPDGLRLVSGGIDFTARVWDATPLPREILRTQDAGYLRKRKALAELARAVEDSERAENLAKSGQWDLAAAAFGKFVEQEPDNLVLRYPQIRALLEANAIEGARRACEDLLKRSANATTTDLTLANNVVWSCVLTPDAVADPGALVRLAEAASKLHPLIGREGNDRLRILGAALYRAGRFAEAIGSLEKSHQNRGGDGDPRGFAFLAMAHYRLGHRDEAKRWLDKLAAYQPKEGSDLSWDEVEIRILRREAESVVMGTPPAARSSASP